MKVVEIRESFGPDSLQLVERPEPVPGPAQVLLKMKAFSINYRELLVVNGVSRWKLRAAGSRSRSSREFRRLLRGLPPTRKLPLTTLISIEP